MPIYEYCCGQCEHPFEKYARTFNEHTQCPSCGASDVTKLLSTFAVSSGSGGGRSEGVSAQSNCGEGPPCGAAHCGRLPN